MAHAGTLTDRAALRSHQARRRRLIVQSLIFFAVTVGMVVVLTYKRDEQSVRSCARRLEFARDRFQAALDRHEPLPAFLPLPDEQEETTDFDAADDSAKLRDHYLFSSRLIAGKSGEVGVACCFHPHRLYTRGNGRHVLIYDAQPQRFRVEWMPEAPFAARAAALGLHLPTQTP
jgi:hypothetical protein